MRVKYGKSMGMIMRGGEGEEESHNGNERGTRTKKNSEEDQKNRSPQMCSL